MCRVGRRFSAAPLLADSGSRRSVSPTSMTRTTVSVSSAEVASSKAVEGAGFPLWLGGPAAPQILRIPQGRIGWDHGPGAAVFWWLLFPALGPRHDFGT